MKYVKLFEEFTSEEKKYGVVMVNFDFPVLAQMEKEIDKKDVYEEEGKTYGKHRSDPHVTLLYGLHSEEIPSGKVMEIAMKYLKNKPEIKLFHASVFENEKFDVLKFDADSDALVHINKELRKFPHTNAYPKYEPHCTVAYLKKNKAQNYVYHLREKVYYVKPKQITYTKPDGSKIVKDL